MVFGNARRSCILGSQTLGKFLAKMLYIPNIKIQKIFDKKKNDRQSLAFAYRSIILSSSSSLLFQDLDCKSTNHLNIEK